MVLYSSSVSVSLMPNEYNLRSRPEHERWKPTTKYKPADSPFNKDEPRGFNGEDYYHLFLTTRERSLHCTCVRPTLQYYSHLEVTNPRTLPFGVYCGDCLLPRWDFISKLLRACNGCGISFVLLGKTSDFDPKKRDLCEECFNKAPVSKRVRRVSAVKIG